MTKIKKNRIKIIICIVLACFLGASGFLYYQYVQDNKPLPDEAFTVKDGCITKINTNKYGGNVIVPEKINNKKITGINWNGKSGYEKVTNFDISRLKDLKDIHMILPSSLSTVDLSNNTKLESIDVAFWYGDKNKALDLSHNTKLKKVRIYYSDLGSINLSNCKELEELDLRINKLTKINLSDCQNVKVVSLRKNNLKSVDVSKNKKLKSLGVDYNKRIKIVDVSKNPYLEYLGTSNTQVKELDLSKNPRLDSILISNTKIKELDISHNLLLKDEYIEKDDTTTIKR
ncbi:MAG: hypothetical protein PHH04_01710 [Thomasclavelia sp.]|nr:hypothetical protein [Thomasclavelia sp.]